MGNAARTPGYLYILYSAKTNRYCIRSTQGDERISRYYASRAAVDKHVARLLERGWDWAANKAQHGKGE
jgi:hypothetical protein